MLVSGGSSGEGVGNGTIVEGQRPSTLNYNGGCYTRFDAGQCTWHCYGRAKEVTGKTLEFSVSSNLHAKNWIKYVTNCKVVNTPQANSIAVWDNGGSYGHVGYIEKVSGNTIYFTEANWGPANNVVDASDGVVKTISATAIKLRDGFKIMGYIVL